VFSVYQEAIKVDYKHWAATNVAMIGNRDNDTPVQSQHERDKRFRREAVAGNEGGRVRTT